MRESREDREPVGLGDLWGMKGDKENPRRLGLVGRKAEEGEESALIWMLVAVC